MSLWVYSDSVGIMTTRGGHFFWLSIFYYLDYFTSLAFQ
jgi:hypothetical protein